MSKISLESVTYLRAGVTMNLEVGAGYVSGENKAVGSATVLLKEETRAAPTFMLGIGTRSVTSTDFGAYLSMSKDFRPFIKLPVRAWVVLNQQVTDENKQGKKLRAGGGIGYGLTKKAYVTLQTYEWTAHVATLQTKISYDKTIGLWGIYLPDAKQDKARAGFFFSYTFSLDE